MFDVLPGASAVKPDQNLALSELEGQDLIGTEEFYP